MVKAAVGYQLAALSADLPKELTLLLDTYGFSFAVSPLFPAKNGTDALPIADIILKSADWNSRIIGLIDCSDLDIDPKNAPDAIRRQMDYMNYTGVYGICLDCPISRSGVVTLASVINDSLHDNKSHAKIFVCITMDLSVQSVPSNGTADTDFYTDSWRQWNDLRSLLHPTRKVSVGLELGGDLPDDNGKQCERWAGEPVSFIGLSTSSFIVNAEGFPVLAKGYQIFISMMMEGMSGGLFFVIRGEAQIKSLREHCLYMEHLINNTKEVDRDRVSILKGTQDLIQHPLQPLKDNLESATYEVFEKDPVKYEKYREAILEAIRAKKKIKQDIVLLVVGAGRGPLVTASVYGAEDAGAKVTIYVVEKNVNALPTLSHWKKEKWDKSTAVTTQIFHTDMRTFVSEKKADIVVSELLGSFSDNELSPECLDGVYRSVHPDAISIPQEYSSHLHPVMSSKLWTTVLSLDGPAESTTVMESNYVVNMRNIFRPCATKPLFKFEHKDLSLAPDQRDNTRIKTLSFESPVDYLCHGFAGYFDTLLYGNIVLSTRPEAETDGMFSWFPIFFPLVQPIQVAAGQKVTVTFWRKTSATAVWYEFAVIEPVFLPIQNTGGRSHNIGL